MMSQGYLIELLADHETIMSQRKYLCFFTHDYNDLGTNDFFIAELI
jgi:hypothetical protein